MGRHKSKRRPASKAPINGDSLGSPLLGPSAEQVKQVVGLPTVSQCAAAVFNVANAAIGAGMLAFPFAYEHTGHVAGALLTVAAAAVLSYTMLVLLDASREQSKSTYHTLVIKLFGQGAGTFLEISIVVYFFLCCVSFLMIIGSMAQPAIEAMGGKGTIFYDKQILSVIGACILFPLCLVLKVESLGFTSFIALGSMLFTVITIITHAVQKPDTQPGDVKSFDISLRSFQAIPIICFALQCHMTGIPAIYSVNTGTSTAHRRRLIAVIVGAMGLCLLFYIPTGIFGYLTFGPHTLSDILDNYGKTDGGNQVPVTPDVFIARACVGITAILTFPVVFFPTRAAMLDLINADVKPFKNRLIAALCFVAPVTGFAVLVESLGLDIGFIMQLIGSTVAVVVLFLFPALVLWQSRKVVSASIVAFIGICISVLGFSVTVAMQICQNNNSSFCTKLKA